MPPDRQECSGVTVVWSGGVQLKASHVRGDRRGETTAKMRDVLADRRIRKVLTADAVSGTGDTIYWIALIVLLLERQPNGGLVALAVAARLIPRVVFSAVGGVAADRFDRRRLLITLDSIRAVCMVALAFIAATGGPVIVALMIVFVTCALTTPYRPTMSAAYPRLVDETELAAANALSNGVAQVTTLIGPLLAALILAVGTPTWAFVANGATYAIAAVLLFGVTGLGRAGRREGDRANSLLGDLAEGARSIRVNRGVGALMMLTGAMMVLRGFELVLHVQVALIQLDLGPSGYGVMSGALGFGALIVMPVVGRLTATARPAALLTTSALVGCATLALLAAVTSPWIALAILALEGASVVCFEVMALTLMQRVCRSEVLGRVLGLQNTLSGTAKLVGSVMAPMLVAGFGLSTALVVAAIAVAGPTLLVAPRLRSLNDASAARAAEVAPIVTVLDSLGVFDGAPRPALERLAMRVVIETVQSHTVIVREGDQAADFFVLRSGTVRVERGGIRVNTQQGGSWFGEIGLLRSAPRKASVIAESPVVLWRMSGGAFLDAVASAPILPGPLSDDAMNKILAGGR